MDRVHKTGKTSWTYSLNYCTYFVIVLKVPFSIYIFILSEDPETTSFDHSGVFQVEVKVSLNHGYKFLEEINSAIQ